MKRCLRTSGSWMPLLTRCAEKQGDHWLRSRRVRLRGTGPIPICRCLWQALPSAGLQPPYWECLLSAQHTNADIWLLTIHTETVEETNGNAANNAYLQQLLYASYYNSLYGGYGGYGGYGYGGYGGYGYGNSYSNYYTYAMLAQLMSQSSQSTYSTSTELDKDRYYCGILCGPDAARKPMFRVTFAISKE